MKLVGVCISSIPMVEPPLIYNYRRFTTPIYPIGTPLLWKAHVRNFLKCYIWAIILLYFSLKQRQHCYAETVSVENRREGAESERRRREAAGGSCHLGPWDISVQLASVTSSDNTNQMPYPSACVVFVSTCGTRAVRCPCGIYTDRGLCVSCVLCEAVQLHMLDLIVVQL